jgi:gas vesicle protein
MVETKENEYTQHVMSDSPAPPPYNPEWTESVSCATSAAYNPAYHREGDSFRSTTSAPARMDASKPTIASIPDKFPPFPEEYHVPPFASAVPVGAAATTEKASAPKMNHPVPTHVEHVIMDEEEDQEREVPPPANGAKAHPSNARPRFVRVSNDRRREWFFKPYAHKLAWKTYRVSKAALKKTVKATKEQVPKVKHAANRSASLVKETSQRSASFVKEVSQRSASSVVEFNEKHQVVPKARHTVRMMGREVKRASISTARGIRNLETKHHLWSKSQRSLSEGTRAAKYIWKGRRRASI